MAEFHFVEDYETYVRSLIASYPIDEAIASPLVVSIKNLAQLSELCYNMRDSKMECL